MHENRDISTRLRLYDEGRSAKAINRNVDMHVLEKSDSAVVPVNQPNKEAKASAEAGEGRAQMKKNIAQLHMHPTQSGDLWADVWRRKAAKGDVIIVRYADDLVMGFQQRADAVRFLEEFKERLAKFGLELHPDKTRLIEFGRYAARKRKQRGAKGNRRPSRSWASLTTAGDATRPRPSPSGGLLETANGREAQSHQG